MAPASDRAIPMVATADIGQTCADLLLQEWQGTQVWELHGPQPLSPNNVAASFGKTVKRDMMRAFNNGTMVFEEQETQQVFGKATVDEVVQSWANTKGQS